MDDSFAMSLAEITILYIAFNSIIAFNVNSAPILRNELF